MFDGQLLWLPDKLTALVERRTKTFLHLFTSSGINLTFLIFADAQVQNYFSFRVESITDQQQTNKLSRTPSNK